MPDSPLLDVTAVPPLTGTASDGDGSGTDSGPAAPLTNLGADDAPVCADGVCAL